MRKWFAVIGLIGVLLSGCVQSEMLVENDPPKEESDTTLQVYLDVENLMQQPALPNGCEVVSLAMVLRYAGFDVDPVQLYEQWMPKSPYKQGDPWITYVGDATGCGLGCYAPCVERTGNAYLKSIGSYRQIEDVSEKAMSYYEHCIDNAVPVILWGLKDMNGNADIFWSDTIDGKEVDWHRYSHCVVLIGYTDTTYLVCDPLKGIVEYEKGDVERSFEINYRQACVIR